MAQLPEIRVKYIPGIGPQRLLSLLMEVADRCIQPQHSDWHIDTAHAAIEAISCYHKPGIGAAHFGGRAVARKAFLC